MSKSMSFLNGIGTKNPTLNIVSRTLTWPTMPFGTNSKGTKHNQFVQVYASDDGSIKIGTRCASEDFGGVFVLSRCFLDFSVIELSQISSFFSYRGIAILKIDTTISTFIFLLVTGLKQNKSNTMYYICRHARKLCKYARYVSQHETFWSKHVSYKSWQHARSFYHFDKTISILTHYYSYVKGRNTPQHSRCQSNFT